MKDAKYQARARGRAAECLVEADLLNKGLEVTRPSVDNGDDLHAKFDTGWQSIQVKTKRPNCWGFNNGKFRNQAGTRVPRRPLTSQIVAVVDTVSGEIRYLPVGVDPVPQELG